MKQSAGIVLYRINKKEIEVLLVHPGGPYWTNKDAGAWSIPKGEFTADEDALTAAKRELKEETGISCNGPFIPLPVIKQKSGKAIYAWITKCDAEAGTLTSNSFELEWPPHSGMIKSFPEVDKAEWFSTAAAKEKINQAQIVFIDTLIEYFDDMVYSDQGK